MVLDIDAKIIRPGYEIEKITLRQLIQNKVNNFGGVRIYVVTHRFYKKASRERVVAESIRGYFDKRDRINHSYVKSFVVGIRYLFMRRKHYLEDLSFKGRVSCSEMVAQTMKRAGMRIGRKASYNFVPSQFLFSKYFKVKGKISVR